MYYSREERVLSADGATQVSARVARASMFALALAAGSIDECTADELTLLHGTRRACLDLIIRRARHFVRRC